MATTKKRTNRKKMQKNRVAQLSRGLDAGAAAYAQLLMDPCQAPLVHPIYSGGDGGYLGRYEADVLLNSTGVGAALFAPGCIGISAINTGAASGVNSIMQLANSSDGLSPSSDTTACQWVTATAALGQPGYGSLFNVSATVRPVAACVQLFYPGSELNRAGVVSMARVNAGQILGDNGNGPTVAQYRAISNMVTRTPENYIETKWVPGDGDMLYTDPTLITTLREAERKNGILITWSGLPAVANASIRLRFVVVYEWMPGAISSGVLSNSASRGRSTNTLDQILNALDRAGNWWTSYGPTVGRVAYGAYKAYQALGGSGGSRLALTM